MELLLFQSLWACGAEFSAYRRFMSLIPRCDSLKIFLDYNTFSFESQLVFFREFHFFLESLFS